MLLDLDSEIADKEYLNAVTFEDATRTLVRTISKEKNVKVQFNGSVDKNSAWASLDTVNLPQLNITSKLTRKQYHVGQGFANHETLHHVCSDLNEAKKRVEIYEKSGKHLTKKLANAIEDVRIEKVGGKLYDGIPQHLEVVSDFTCKHFIEEVYPHNTEVVNKLSDIAPVAVTWIGRKKLLNYDSPYLDKCIDLLPKDIKDRVERWCDTLIDELGTGFDPKSGEFSKQLCKKDSHDVFDVAEILAAEIEKQSDDNCQNQPDGSDGDGEGDDNQQQGDGQSPPSDNNGNNNKKNNQQKDKDQQQQQQQQQNVQQNSQSAIDPEQMMKDSVNDLMYDNSKKGKAITPLTLENDRLIKKNDIKRTFAKNGLTDYNKTKDQIKGTLSVIKRKLERALETESQTQNVNNLTQGRLYLRGNNLLNAYKGKDNVHRKNIEGRSIDTAVQIVIDLSGSMSGSKIRTAQQTCVALVETLQGIDGVEIEVLGYSNNGKYSNISTNGLNVHRTEGLDLVIFKDFDDALRDTKQCVGGINNAIRDCTPTGDAILESVKRLVKRKKNKRLMFVLTDGEPGGYSYNENNPKQMCKDVVKFVESLNIPCIAFGIQAPEIKDTFSKFVTVNDLNDLGSSVFEVLSKHLLDKGKEKVEMDVELKQHTFNKRR